MLKEFFGWLGNRWSFRQVSLVEGGDRKKLGGDERVGGVGGGVWKKVVDLFLSLVVQLGGDLDFDIC